MSRSLEQLKSIKSFPSLVKYLRDELDWPIESDDVEDLTFEYEPEELGLDKQTAVKIKEIKQLRPLADNQPWGIFYINFEPKRLPIVALRRILRSLVVKKRASGSRAQQRAWQQNDLLFISSYGETDGREMTFAHFSENSGMGDLPTLKVLGWSAGNTELRLESTYNTLREKLRWPEDETAADEWRESWSSAFKLQYMETVRTSKDLAVRLARLAEVIRERVNEVLSVESERGELRKLYKAFQEALIHDLDEDDFADMYAQTIAYGLLSASISRQSGALVADNLKDMVPNTNPFLKELMQTFLTVGGRKGKIDFDELGINEVVELLRHTQMDEVLKDFGARNPQEDPVIHFYELFLKEYDPDKRMKRGVFYTPRPVVSFIVRSVDEILRTEFGLEDGLADTTTWGEMRKRHAGLSIPESVKPDEPFVQILDPATGTGTFLVEVIDRIYETLRAKWRREGKSEREMIELWNDYVPRHLLPRLHGFELMMAPYAIAHMKIGLKLTETKCYMSRLHERARIYLTNSLEEPREFPLIEQYAPALAHEAEVANKIKRSSSITVILGNPPYSGHSSNIGAWIMGLLRGRDMLTNETTGNYFEFNGRPLGEKNPKWLNDDYVKFIRYAQRFNERVKVGLLAVISNNGYLDNPTFRGMRQSLTETYNKIYLLDLHGSAKKKERHPDGSKDENVFDIEQGVGIGTFVSTPGKHMKHISHAHLYGVRESANGRVGKYEWLSKNDLHTTKWTDIELQEPFYLLIPQDSTLSEEFSCGWKITDAMPVNSVGIVTARDTLTIHFTETDVWTTVKDFANLLENAARTKYDLGKDARDWKVKFAQGDLIESGLKRERIVPILYRPFDVRFTYYTGNSRGFHCMPRPEVMRNMLTGENVGFHICRQISTPDWQHVLITKFITDDSYVSNKTSERGYTIPLYLYPNAKDKLFGVTSRRPNFSKECIQDFAKRLQLSFTEDERGDLQESFGAENIFHYIYAVLHSPTYRTRYAEFLKIDFPRIPLTSDAELFRKLCALGADLVALHLIEDDYEAASWNASRPKGKSPLKTPITRLAGRGDAEVAKGHPKYKDGKVYINLSRYFEGVPTEVWNFHVGGYQVCEKWLKDRRERTLSDEDIAHYQRVVVALNETIRLMAEIDQTIEEHGGWPLVGSQETAQQQPAPDSLPFA